MYLKPKGDTTYKNYQETNSGASHILAIHGGLVHGLVCIEFTCSNFIQQKSRRRRFSRKVRDPWYLDGGALLYVLLMEMGGMGGNIRTCQVCDGVPLYKCFIQAGGVSGSCSGVMACDDESVFDCHIFSASKSFGIWRKNPMEAELHVRWAWAFLQEGVIQWHDGSSSVLGPRMNITYDGKEMISRANKWPHSIEGQFLSFFFGLSVGTKWSAYIGVTMRDSHVIYVGCQMCAQ